MQIVTMQRRLVEVGRIRMGEKRTSQNGKTYPAKLEHFRLTSRDKARLDAAAVLYGGEVKPWEGQWELYTNTDVLPVVVVPGQALSQSFELWGQKTINGRKTAVICLRRCDGNTEYLSDEPCLCANEAQMTCKPMTRLSVVLTEVPGIGVWRVEAHGWNALSEVAGCVQLLEALVATGQPVRARLRLDTREQPTETETRHFVVPVIDIDHTLGQVLDSIGHSPAPALPAGQRTFEPVPVAALPEAPSSSVAAQVAAVTEPGVRAPRRNAAEPIRPTGLAPRTAAEAAGEPQHIADVRRALATLTDAERMGLSAWWKGAGYGSIKDGTLGLDEAAFILAEIARLIAERPFDDGSDPGPTPAEVAPTQTVSAPASSAPAASDNERPPTEPEIRDVAILADKVFKLAYDAAVKGEKTKVRDRLRRALTFATTGKVHLHDLDMRQLIRVDGKLREIERGTMQWQVYDDGVTFTVPTTGNEHEVRWAELEGAG